MTENLSRDTYISDAKNSFATYKHYLTGFSYLTRNLYPSRDSLLGSLKDVDHVTKGDTRLIKQVLFNSWNTEILLNTPLALSAQMVKYSNHWSSVQSYYSIYLSIRALFLAKDRFVDEKHEKTLKTVTSLILDEGLFPQPWNLVADGTGFRNMPEDNNAVWDPLENPYFFKGDVDKLWICPQTFIKTTRNRKLDKYCEKWKKEHKKTDGKNYVKLPAGMRETINASLRPYSIFDCFYRLRIRSNYEDADMFLVGASEFDSLNYIRALCEVTDRTLLIIESYISQMVGKDRLQSLIDEFEFQNAPTMELLDEGTGIFGRKFFILS